MPGMRSEDRKAVFLQARRLRLTSGLMRCKTSHAPARAQGDISAQVGLHPPVPLDCVQRLLPQVCCLHSTAHDSFLLIIAVNEQQHWCLCLIASKFLQKAVASALQLHTGP